MKVVFQRRCFYSHSGNVLERKAERGETQRRLSAERAEVQHRESLFSQQEPEVTLDTERDHVHRRWRQVSFYQSLHALDVRRVD